MSGDLTPGLSVRAEFPIFEHTTYANSCSQGALANRVRTAAEEWLEAAVMLAASGLAAPGLAASGLAAAVALPATLLAAATGSSAEMAPAAMIQAPPAEPWMSRSID